MKKLLHRLFDVPGSPQKSSRESSGESSGESSRAIMSYEDARNALEQQNREDKELLARNRETPPEMLYFLAEDADPAIRRDVAGNPGTPVQADAVLADDGDADVRVELARKIARIFPDLPPPDQTRIREKTIEILEKLAHDQVPQVRRMLAEELKSCSLVPRPVIRHLAGDEDLGVCAPILEYSPLLNEADLREIIAVSSLSGALQAIARRRNLSANVADAITNTLDIPAMTTLLTNPSAQIREETLNVIINQARHAEILHQPLVDRPNLSLRTIKRIAGFVASSLVDRMIERHHLDKAVAEEILTRVRERIRAQQVGDEDIRTLAEQARDLYDKGVVDDDFIKNALANQQRELVVQCLALLAGLPADSVRKILKSKKGRRIVSLAWRAGLDMRTALDLQNKLAFIPPENFINAKGGTEYPLSVPEMEYELALYE